MYKFFKEIRMELQRSHNFKMKGKIAIKLENGDIMNEDTVEK